MLLGVIADDLTGATDVALMLAREGMRVIQTVGVPALGSRVARRRRRRRLDEVAHQPCGRGGGMVARGLRCPSRGRCAADPVQILLHLRFHRCRQYRPRCGGADEAARCGLHGRVSGLSRERALGLPGASLRRLGVAVGQPDEGPPADADARFQPGSRAGAADGLPVGLVPFQTVSKGAAATRGAFEALAEGWPCDRRRGRDHGPGPPHARCGVRRGAAPDGRLGHRARPPREFPARRPVAACFRLAALQCARGAYGGPGR